jgi:23S rRNA pseudouridine955/2504/2580 synthase
MVIHRDAAAIVVDKPPGLATQGGTKTNAHLDRLLDGLADEDEPRPKLVHRLDKDTSGVLLLARTPRAAAFFSKAFSGRTARKVYWALVVGVPSVEDGLIDLPIAKQPGTGGEKMHVDEAEGQPSRTRYRVVERAGNRAAWVELQPHTGRTHQLRVHMAAIGHPIVGDGKYAGQDAFLTGSISRKLHLHARRLRIDHPDGGRIEISAEPPEHFRESLASLGFDPSLGDLPLDEVKYSETAEGKRKATSAAAKARPQGAPRRAPQPQARLMHPNRAFDWQDQGAMFAFVREIAFCTICIDGPMVVHAPVVVDGSDRLRFHVSRANRTAAALDGARALVSCLGPEAYISPDWYGTPDQVPTWNYLAVEAEGVLRRLDEAELARLLDDLSAEHEARLAPKPAWTRDKMKPDRFDAMLKAIIGFELNIESLRGTRKLGQNKREAERLAA